MHGHFSSECVIEDSVRDIFENPLLIIFCGKPLLNDILRDVKSSQLEALVPVPRCSLFSWATFMYEKIEKFMHENLIFIYDSMRFPCMKMTFSCMKIILPMYDSMRFPCMKMTFSCMKIILPM